MSSQIIAKIDAHVEELGLGEDDLLFAMPPTPQRGPAPVREVADPATLGLTEAHQELPASTRPSSADRAMTPRVGSARDGNPFGRIGAAPADIRTAARYITGQRR